MRRGQALTATCAVLSAVIALSLRSAGAEDAASCAASTAAVASAPETIATLAWPGGAREDLRIPEPVWARALEGLGVSPAGGALGFTTDQLSNYGRDQRITRPIAMQFRDVRGIPRTAGKVTDDLLAAASDPGEFVRIAYTLTDAVAGRDFPRPKGAEWGVDWLPATTPPVDALETTLARIDRLGATDGTKHALPDHPELSDATRTAWRALPEPVQRLVIRLLVASAEATPWLRRAFDEAWLSSAVGGRGAHDLTQPRLLSLASRPWTEETEDQTATLSKESFDALGEVDRDYLAYGSVIYLSHVAVALSEWREATKPEKAPRPGFDPKKIDGGPLWIDTPLGAVRVLGSGDDAVDGPMGAVLLLVDCGGNDKYSGRLAVPSYPVAPISTLIDLSGSDTYDGNDVVGTMGCGLFGLGALIDLQGDDRYTVRDSGLGCAWYGTGLVLDEAGDDVYVTKTRWGEGAAHVGVGCLVDLAGNDSYECAEQSQGLGSTYGAGILMDVAGNDAYVARDDGNREKIYLDQSVAMAQGAGYGRRADLGDGHSLAGGFGILVDGAGDDRYHAQVWAQGVGYWWAVGLLEDRGGNDVYENGKYSLGAAAHFGVGCQVDLAGDDSYNGGVSTAVDQYQGHARDGSIGISIDGDGNDRYQFRNLCGGSADLCSLALFWDRRGNDCYAVRWNALGPPNGWTDTPPMGTATRSEVMRSFRDDLPNYGVFLDTGGKDTFTWDDMPAVSSAFPSGTPFGADNMRWRYRNGPPDVAGVGLDVDAYPTPAPKN